MVLLSKFSDPDCQFRIVLMLTCLLYLLLPAPQPLAKTCGSCGLDYDDETFSSCPTSSCNKEAKYDFPQHETATPQGSTPVNPDSNPCAQVDKSERNFDFAMKVFYQTSGNILENFVMSPDSLLQTVALLLLHAGTNSTDVQLRRIYRPGYDYQPSDTAASGATAGGQNQSPSSIILLAASQPEALEVYRERLKQVNNTPGNVDCTIRGQTQSLGQLLNKLFCQLTHGIIQDFCTPDAYPFHLSLSIEVACYLYFLGMWRMSSGTDSAYLFNLPDDQADALKRIMEGKTNPSRYARYNNWKAFNFPFRGDNEIILILPPAGVLLYGLRGNIISALISSFDSKESFSSSSTTTPEFPPSKADKNTDLSEALSRSGSGLLSAAASDLSSGAMPGLPVRSNMFSEQGTRDAALTHAGSDRTHERDTIRPIRFDLPFIYILRNRITKRIIYIGRLFYPRGAS
ncbi:serpin family protein [Endozoicomonas sp. 8E]|uniref:serpin family protein n=1 Tax=Endozoicomonas sp. 8E TaxID=3035692 RepID=UPI002938EBD4|nr:serpin family protein [Endozoicomonas sp. 8E]WOG25601.1 serpin family protein [Endozoicomonas sp. 8E]